MRQEVRADRPLDINDGYDVSPDGRRILMLQNATEDLKAGELLVVQNWYAEFERR